MKTKLICFVLRAATLYGALCSLHTSAVRMQYLAILLCALCWSVTSYCEGLWE